MRETAGFVPSEDEEDIDEWAVDEKDGDESGAEKMEEDPLELSGEIPFAVPATSPSLVAPPVLVGAAGLEAAAGLGPGIVLVLTCLICLAKSDTVRPNTIHPSQIYPSEAPGDCLIVCRGVQRPILLQCGLPLALQTKRWQPLPLISFSFWPAPAQSHQHKQ